MMPPNGCSPIVSLLLLLSANAALGLDNGLGRTPPMGWDPWNGFRTPKWHCPNQTVIAETADAFISTGLYKLGYEYVNLDGCWSNGRNAQGVIQPNPDVFWDMPGLVDYVHSKGLKFGIYATAGTPGSLGHEDSDARTFAGWKVDYLKYDHVNGSGISPKIRFPPMRDALNKTGRPIFFCMSVGGQDDPATWAATVGNSWRTTHDIKDHWDNVITCAEQTNRWWKYAAPGGWNDPDMLEIGNGRLTVTESETQFSLWCLMKAPLIMGTDIRNMSKDTLRIFSNADLIAINQDPLGVQGRKVKSEGKESLEQEVWAGELSDGAFAVLLLNKDTDTAEITANWSDFGLDPSTEAQARDLWQHKDVGTMKGNVTASVPSHGVVVYRITPL